MKITQFLSYVPVELKQKAKIKAVEEDVPLTGVVCEWLRLWVEGKLPTPNIKRKKRTMKEKEEFES